MRRLSTLGCAILVPCILGLGCSHEDKSTPVKIFPALTVSLPGNTPAAGTVRFDAADLPVLLVRVSGDAVQDTRISSLALTFRGSGNPAKVSTVRLYRDDGPSSAGVFDPVGDTLLGTAAFAGSSAVFPLAPPEPLAAAGALDLFVVYTFSGTSTPAGGETYGASLEANADLVALSASSSLSALVSGAPVQGSLFVVAGRFLVSTGSAMPAAAAHPVGAGDVAMLQVRLSAAEEGIAVATVAFSGAASPGSLSQLLRAELVMDANANGSYEAGTDAVLDGPRSFSGGTATFAPARMIAAGATENWLLLFDFGTGHANGDSFTASLAGAASFSASGAVSGQPAFVSVSPAPLSGNAQSVQGMGALAVANGGHTPANGNVGPNASNVLLLDLSVSETSGFEAAALNSLRFVFAGGGSPTGNPQGAISAVKLWRDDGDDVFEPGSGDTLVQTGTVGASNDATLASLGQTVAASGTASFWLAADFNGTASSGSTFTASLANADVGATGATTGLALSATGGPVNARTVTISTASGGTLTVSAAAGDASLPNFLRRTAAGANSNAVAALFSLSPTGDGANVSSITLTHGGTASGQNHVAAIRIWADVGSAAGAVDGTDVLVGSVPSGYGAGGTATISVTRNIGMGNSEDWIVAYDLTDACPYARTFTVTVASTTDVSATGSSSGNPMTVSGPSLSSGTRSLGGTWVQLGPTGTRPGLAVSNYTRMVYASAYDSTSNRMLIHGGRDDGSNFSFNFFPDTWALDLTAGSEQWNLLNSGASAGDPPVRWHHSGIYHVQGGTGYFLIWGGRLTGSSGAIQNNTYQLNLSTNTWSQVSPTNSPPNGREGFGAVWDRTGNRMLVFGGWEPGTGTMQADVWELTLGSTPTWTQLLTGSAAGAPSARYFATCVLDASTNPARMIVHGGETASAVCLLDAYALSLGSTPTWSTLSSAAQIRSFHPHALDSTANQVVVFGGWNSTLGSTQNDTEAFDLGLNAPSGTWGYRLTSGTAPTAREEARGVWDTVSNRFVIYGGWRAWGQGTPDVWSFR